MGNVWIRFNGLIWFLPNITGITPVMSRRKLTNNLWVKHSQKQDIETWTLFWQHTCTCIIIIHIRLWHCYDYVVWIIIIKPDIWFLQTEPLIIQKLSPLLELCPSVFIISRLSVDITDMWPQSRSRCLWLRGKIHFSREVALSLPHSEKGSVLKERICSPWQQILSF